MVSLQFEETSTGGGGVHVEKICEQFLKSNHLVTLVSIHTEKSIDRSALENWYVPLSIEKRDNLTVVRLLIDEGIPHPYYGEKSVELNRIERFARAAIHWINENNEFDVINLHGHHIIPGMMARELKGIGARIVSTVHALETTYMMKKGEFVGSFRPTASIINKIKKWEAMSSNADFIVLNSPTVRDDFIKILKKQAVEIKSIEPKIRLISSGCNENFLMDDEEIQNKMKSAAEKVNVVTFCRLDPSKGIEFSIQGMKIASLISKKSFEYTVAGIPSSDEYLNKIKNQMDDLDNNLKIRLKVFNSISTTEEKKELLDPSHIYILPTLKEPFGMSIIEASARGNIIIATDNTGPRYMMRDDKEQIFDWGKVTRYGILVNISENFQKDLPSNIGKAVVWATENWGRCTSNILNFNRKIRQLWTWEGISKQYLKLFSE